MCICLAFVLKVGPLLLCWYFQAPTKLTPPSSQATRPKVAPPTAVQRFICESHNALQAAVDVVAPLDCRRLVMHAAGSPGGPLICQRGGSSQRPAAGRATEGCTTSTDRRRQGPDVVIPPRGAR